MPAEPSGSPPRERAPATAGAAELRLRLMLEASPTITWTLDRDLRFTSSVGAGLAALGLKPDEVVGRSLFEYFGTDDPDFLPIAAVAARAGGRERLVRDRVRRTPLPLARRPVTRRRPVRSWAASGARRTSPTCAEPRRRSGGGPTFEQLLLSVAGAFVRAPARGAGRRGAEGPREAGGAPRRRPGGALGPLGGRAPGRPACRMDRGGGRRVAGRPARGPGLRLVARARARRRRGVRPAPGRPPGRGPRRARSSPPTRDRSRSSRSARGRSPSVSWRSPRSAARKPGLPRWSPRSLSSARSSRTPSSGSAPRSSRRGAGPDRRGRERGRRPRRSFSRRSTRRSRTLIEAKNFYVALWDAEVRPPSLPLFRRRIRPDAGAEAARPWPDRIRHPDGLTAPRLPEKSSTRSSATARWS